MGDALWWMYVVTAILFGVTVSFAIWVSYVLMETQQVMDELETQILGILDDALQILIPTAILNYISQFDIGNFEMNSDAASREKNKKNMVLDIRYAEDVSLPLSERSQMYTDFGDSGETKATRNRKANKEEMVGETVGRVQSLHSIEVLAPARPIESAKPPPAVEATKPSRKEPKGAAMERPKPKSKPSSERKKHKPAAKSEKLQTQKSSLHKPVVKVEKKEERREKKDEKPAEKCKESNGKKDEQPKKQEARNGSEPTPSSKDSSKDSGPAAGEDVTKTAAEN